MKIILLNPFINAEHSVARYLQKKGIGLLLASNPEEAWQVLQLHGSSIDLAIVHREGTSHTDSEPGMKFLARVKGDAAQQDLPVIVTSGIWRDVEFARHQQTATGANAYLSAPFHEKQLIELIEAVLGQQLQDEPTLAPTGFPIADDTNGVAPGFKDMGDATNADSGFSAPIQLEDIGSSSVAEEAPRLTLVAPSDDVFADSANDGTALLSPEDNLSGISLSEPVEAADDNQATRVLPRESHKALDTDEPEPEHSTQPPVADDDIALREMSYLFDEKSKGRSSTDSVSPSRQPHHAALIGQPIGDSVVPGGASQAPDTDTLKRYLMLREQDVSVLSSQLRTAQEQIRALELNVREERSKSDHLAVEKNEQERRIENFERDKALAIESVQTEISELNFQLKARSDKAKALEHQVRDAANEMERLKERVRVDIRKIRVREKELENRLEIVKKDSEALIGARENKIIELKRKLDILEFNLDLLQNQYNREKENSAQLRERLAKAAQVVKVAGGLLQPGSSDGESSGSRVKSNEAGNREAS